MKTSSHPPNDPDHTADQRGGDLARLREEFDGWTFGRSWVTASNGPDACRLLAMRDWDEKIITAWSAASLAEQIRAEES